MQNIDSRLTEKGFTRLQEKEDCVFYEKSIGSDLKLKQICIVYDKKEKKIRSYDTYTITDKEMKITSHTEQEMNHLLKTV
jgi:hypothetical protein